MTFEINRKNDQVPQLKFGSSFSQVERSYQEVIMDKEKV